MSTWILFVFVVFNNHWNGDKSTNMVIQTFHSQQSCESAAKALKQSALAYEDIQTVCVEDKSEKNL